MSNILDVAYNEGYNYSKHYIKKRFSSYEEARTWAEILWRQDTFTMAKRHLEDYGYSVDWMAHEIFPIWWKQAKEEEKFDLLLAYYDGKHDFAAAFLNNQERIPFSRK
jgi:hypothetical protein